MNKHLLELKSRLYLLFLTWLSVGLSTYFYKNIFLSIIVDTTGYIGFSKTNPYFIFSNITDIFSVSLSLIFFISNQISFFMLLYHFVVFISSGLYQTEFKKVIRLLKISFSYWIISILILNLIIFPCNWMFFASFQDKTSLNSVSLFFEADFKDFFLFYINSYYLCIINFQILCLILFVVNHSNIDLNKIKHVRKFLYLVFLIFASFVTPPGDLISQFFVTLCFITFYEFSVFLKIFNEF